MKPLYTAEASTTGAGRNGGHGETSDGKVKVDFSMPKELGGAGGAGTNPEQLVALGYSACFESALHFVAGQKKVELRDVKVTCRVNIGRSSTPNCQACQARTPQRLWQRRMRFALTPTHSGKAPP